MRTALVLLTLLIVTNSKAVAKDRADWRQIEKLKLGTEVRVVDRFGNAVDGYVTFVSRDEVKLDASVTDQPGLQTPQAFARTDVREVYKLGKKFERRLSGKSLALSSAVGVIGGIAIGAAIDQAHPSAEDPGQGKLIGGILGLVMGPAALAIGRSVISGLNHTSLIYQAPPAQTTETSEPRAGEGYVTLRPR